MQDYNENNQNFFKKMRDFFNRVAGFNLFKNNVMLSMGYIVSFFLLIVFGGIIGATTIHLLFDSLPTSFAEIQKYFYVLDIKYENFNVNGKDYVRSELLNKYLINFGLTLLILPFITYIIYKLTFVYKRFKGIKKKEIVKNKMKSLLFALGVTVAYAIVGLSKFPITVGQLWFFLKGKGWGNVNEEDLASIDMASALGLYALGAILGLALFYFVGRTFIAKGTEAMEEDYKLDKFISGAKIISADELVKEQIKRKVEGYYITPKIKIDRKYVNQHIGITGGTGAGKTIKTKRLVLDMIHDPDFQEDTTVTFIDKKPEYMTDKRFYNPERDVIHNLADMESAVYDPIINLHTKPQVDSFAESVFPLKENDHNEVFTLAPREIFAALVGVNLAHGENTIWDLKNSCLKWDIDRKSHEIFKTSGTESAHDYLLTDSKQLSNYMGNFAKGAKMFDTYTEMDHKHKEAFDLEDFLFTQKGVRKQFIVLDQESKVSSTVNSTIILNDTINKILSPLQGMSASERQKIIDMEDTERDLYVQKEFGINPKTRHILVLDELWALNKISALKDALTLGRSFGLVVIISVQEFAGGVPVYGKEIIDTFDNNLSTKIFLRGNGKSASKEIEDLVGKTKLERTTISSSIGVENNKDGKSYNKAIVNEEAIKMSEIQAFKDHEFIMKQPNQDWVRSKDNYFTTRTDISQEHYDKGSRNIDEFKEQFLEENSELELEFGLSRSDDFIAGRAALIPCAGLNVDNYYKPISEFDFEEMQRKTADRKIDNELKREKEKEILEQRKAERGIKTDKTGGNSKSDKNDKIPKFG